MRRGNDWERRFGRRRRAIDRALLEELERQIAAEEREREERERREAIARAFGRPAE
jgi:hypothetical protein